jgi:hypothetical protein
MWPLFVGKRVMRTDEAASNRPLIRRYPAVDGQICDCIIIPLAPVLATLLVIPATNLGFSSIE